MSLLGFVKSKIPADSIFHDAVSVMETVAQDGVNTLKFSNGESVPETDLASHPHASGIKEAVLGFMKSHIDLPFVEGENESKVKDGLELVGEGVTGELLKKLAFNQ